MGRAWNLPWIAGSLPSEAPIRRCLRSLQAAWDSEALPRLGQLCPGSWRSRGEESG